MAKATRGGAFAIMRIAFCDDDSRILSELQKYVREFFEQMGVTQPEYFIYHSGDEMLEKCEAVDIAFLDVEMPGVSGLHVGTKLKRDNPRVKLFIVTSYADYLDEAMRVQVFRFLSKPIDKNRLFRNLKDALYQYNVDTHEIPVTTSEGIIVLQAEDIICVENSQRKCLLFTTKGTIQAQCGFEQLKAKLDLPCFYATYRTFVVNMRYVRQITKDTVMLVYKNKKKEAYLARRRYTDFKDAYLLYLESMK